MKALQLIEAGRLALREVPEPQTREGEALVSLRAAALNRRDLWILLGKYPGIRPGVTLGSDGAGVCEGREVLIQPGLNWGPDERFQSPAYEILGMPSDGTFAEKIKVPREQLFPKPPHLSWEQAAALPLAGLTAYRVLFTRCRLQPKERVLITGIGGGVAQMALLFARAHGAEVYVTSGSDAKIEQALQDGAAGGANYRQPDWLESLKKSAGSFDVVIDGTGGEPLCRLLRLCAPAARVGIYGGTLGPLPELSPQLVFWKQMAILGSTMGSPAEFQAMLELVNRQKLVPKVDAVFALEEYERAFERMRHSRQLGKIILKIVAD